ncbi:BnaC07g50380D [Brassica napus]|uniref:BnaC07g50380D protein n=1 Tax=Brassica napus TaxID=3708 RepID=A0A078J2G5_BRANA|nr:BnaC07g50380D [Brassica napus]
MAALSLLSPIPSSASLPPIYSLYHFKEPFKATKPPQPPFSAVSEARGA